MKIECYISRGCSSLEELRANMDQALKEGGIRAEVSYSTIGEERAEELKLAGSPSILVDGRDIFPGGQAGFA
jgi:hypothetical protein